MTHLSTSTVWMNAMVSAFRGLDAAFDADELPLEFILWRDSRRSPADVGSWRPFPARVNDRARRRVRRPAARTRSVRRKQMPARHTV